jgi:hypothetical protein
VDFRTIRIGDTIIMCWDLDEQIREGRKQIRELKKGGYSSAADYN